MRLITLFSIFTLTLSLKNSFAQGVNQKFSYSKISAHCLNADVKAALQQLSLSETNGISKKDSIFVEEIKRRFAHESDQSSYVSARHSSLDDLLRLYRDYWRMSLLNPEQSFDSLLRKNLSTYLGRFTSMPDKVLTEDSLHLLLTKHVEINGYKTTGFGMTGKLYDLLVWKQQVDTL